MTTTSIQGQNSIVWLPVVGYEGLYEVSNTGLVRSLDREILGRDGALYPFKGKLKSQCISDKLRYPMVELYKDNLGTRFYVHRLVATSFLPNPENKPEVNHLDGNRANNSLSNLEWVTSSENSFHASKTGLRVYENRLTKEEFIECLNDVINGESYQSLSLRVPYKVPFLSVKLRRLAKELGLEGELNESLRQQKAARARINGASNSKKFGNFM